MLSCPSMSFFQRPSVRPSVRPQASREASRETSPVPKVESPPLKSEASPEASPVQGSFGRLWTPAPIKPAIMPLAPIPSRVPRRVVILNDPRQIAAMISDMMKKSGLTQAEIGRRMGLKQQTISMYRQGKVRNPSIGWLVRFANALGARIVMEYDETRVR